MPTQVKSGSFVEKVKASRGLSVQTLAAESQESAELMFLIYVEDKEEIQRFFFLKLYPELKDDFLVIVKKKADYNLRDYGDVICSGFGVPHQYIREKIEDEFGVFFDA